MKQPNDRSKKVFMTKRKFILRFIGYHRRYETINVSKKELVYEKRPVRLWGKVKQATPEQGKLII